LSEPQLGIAPGKRLGDKHGRKHHEPRHISPERFMTFDIIKAIILGIVEGLTEFIPVSSTGHLLLVQRFFGFADEDFGKTFAVLIQFGAILALLSIYFGRLWRLAIGFFTDPTSRRFVFGILLSFLPAAIVGALAHDFIKSVLFNEWLICFTLIAGGGVLLWIDVLDLKPRYKDVMTFTMPMYLMIGVIQCLAMIPGVSRSGATIVGAMLMGASKRAAAEFSFFLAIPTMAGAFAYDLLKNYKILSADDAVTIVVGFIAAFVAAVVVVRTLLAYVSRHGFTPFAYWRIIVGIVGLAGLIAFG
jgi:undecaprenyl-diphosphatase